MPDHTSWFNLLPFFDSVEKAMQSAMGVSLIEKTPVHAQHVFGAFFILLLLLLLAVLTSGKLQKARESLVPEDKLTLSTFVELFVGGVYGMMADVMGKKAARFFLPLIGTCAFVILFSNLIGLVPGFLPPTDNLNTTFSMAVVIFVATHVFGLKENGFGHIKHLFGPVLFLAPLFFVIEVISHIVRPVSLGIRLMANMFADHMVLTIVFSLVPLLVPVVPLMLGTLVCVVQTLVFCLLSTIYINMAVEHQEH